MISLRLTFTKADTSTVYVTLNGSNQLIFTDSTGASKNIPAVVV